MRTSRVQTLHAALQRPKHGSTTRSSPQKPPACRRAPRGGRALSAGCRSTTCTLLRSFVPCVLPPPRVNCSAKLPARAAPEKSLVRVREVTRMTPSKPSPRRAPRGRFSPPRRCTLPERTSGEARGTVGDGSEPVGQRAGAPCVLLRRGSRPQPRGHTTACCKSSRRSFLPPPLQIVPGGGAAGRDAS